MELVPQKIKIKISSFENKRGGSVNRKNGPLLPEFVRCLLCGASNAGKTSVMMSLITDKNGLRFKNLYVVSKSLHQPKYMLLDRIMESCPEVGYHKINNLKEMVSPNKVKDKAIVVFDDLNKSDQNTAKEFFTMGRHFGADAFFLTQSYCNALKHEIRDQCNLFIVFNQDMTNIQHLYNEHAYADMSLKKFSEICCECWKESHGFLVINKDCSISEGKYRKGFDTFINIKEGSVGN